MHKTSENNIKLDQRAARRLDQVIKVIKAWAGNSLVEISLFGSYAKGRQHDYSSLDLLIVVSDSKQRFIDRKIEVERLLNESDELPLVDTLVYTESELLDLITKMESFVVSVVDECVVIWNGFNEINIQNLTKDSIVPSKYKGGLPKLEKIYD